MIKFISEEHLENWFYDLLDNNSSNVIEQVTGISFYSILVRDDLEYQSYILKRQPKLGNYGIADIISIVSNCNEIHIDLIELKNVTISIDALVQAHRYVTGLKTFVHDHYKNFSLTINSYIFGPDINKGDWIYLLDNCTTEVYTFKMHTFEGIKFKREHNYSLTNKGNCDFIRDFYNPINDEEE